MMTRSNTAWEPRLLWTTLGFIPHDKQKEILQKVNEALLKKEGAARFIDCPTGRQFGKTKTAVATVWMGLLAPDDDFGPPVVKVIADTFEHGRLIWDQIIGKAFGSDLLRPLVDRYEKEREILWLKNGASAQLLSSDRPQGLTGFTITLAVFDESAFISDDAIEMMMPCLAVRQGVAVAFGTAEGQGWHRTWYLRGQDNNYPDHCSMTYPSTDNPYFPPEELDVQRILLPKRRFEQLYMANWQSEEGAVFHNIDGCILSGQPLYSEPTSGHKYVFGVDFGRHQDYTVIYIGDARTGRVVFEDRFSNSDWMSQIERVEQVIRRYNASGIGDATGVGDVVISALQEHGVDIIGYKFTTVSKERLVQRLVVALEREDIRFPEYPQLLRELRYYERRTLPSGRVQTGAPIGYHDDCVMALALLNETYERGYGSTDRTTVESFEWEGVL